MREMCDVLSDTRTSGFFQISTSIDLVTHVFVYLKKSYRNTNNDQQISFYHGHLCIDGASLSNCTLEYGNSVYYPKIEYGSDSKVRIFNI